MHTTPVDLNQESGAFFFFPLAPSNFLLHSIDFVCVDNELAERSPQFDTRSVSVSLPASESAPPQLPLLPV